MMVKDSNRAGHVSHDPDADSSRSEARAEVAGRLLPCRGLVGRQAVGGVVVGWNVRGVADPYDAASLLQGIARCGLRRITLPLPGCGCSSATSRAGRVHSGRFLAGWVIAASLGGAKSSKRASCDAEAPLTWCGPTSALSPTGQASDQYLWGGGRRPAALASGRRPD